MGIVLFSTFDWNGKPLAVTANGVKAIGKNCVLTSAHTIYGSRFESITSETSDATKKVKFIMGLGKDRKSFDATILYQMTKENIDFKVSDRDENRRLFKGDSDVIILKLNGNSGGAYKRVNAMTPEEFSDGIDLNLGKKIVCYGSPAYKTDKIYGQCKGSDFYWRQYARAFENNTTPQQSGLETNLAAGPGMSGGPCMFIEDTNTIFAISSNGFMGSNAKNPIMPNMTFKMRNYSNGNSRNLSMLHGLDQRIFNDPKYKLHLSQLEKICN